jgi:alanyl-tRNA synthetase
MDRVDEIIRGATGEAGPRDDWRKRVLADHGRAATFLVMDGIYPENVGRGYVLRRILRRAATFGYLLGVHEPFIHRLVPMVVEKMAPGYPELLEKQDVIVRQIEREEAQFARALDRGVPLFLDRAESGGIIDGAFAWDVRSTYGVPFEVMQELASDRGAAIDEEGYARARDLFAAASGKGTAVKHSLAAIDAPATRFLGYDAVEAVAGVLKVLHEDAEVDSLQAGEVGAVVLDETPFYGESGGQVGDTGQLSVGEGGGSLVATVLDTQKRDNVIVHYVRIEQGRIHAGMRVRAEVDRERRDAIRRAHTATHLLHASLRAVLGPHVVQRGSVVEPDRLRFDFAHTGAMTAEELREVEERMNTQVLRNTGVTIEQRSQDEARALGAMMLFGEKYGEVVRVVQVPDFSIELCGGTHVSQTGTIGLIKITSEGSAAAGIRRVECTTGLASLAQFQALNGRLREVATGLGGGVDQIAERLQAQKEQIALLRRQLGEARRSAAGGALDQLLARKTEVGGLAVLAAETDTADADAIKNLADQAAERLKHGVVVLAGASNGRGIFVAKVAGDAAKRGAHAGNLVREVAKLAGGGGGGRPDFAQAGARDAAKIPDALAAVPRLIEAQLG